MSDLVLSLAAVTAAVIAVVILDVVQTTRRDAERNRIWARAHDERVTRWVVAARAGRGDPPRPPRPPRPARQPVVPVDRDRATQGGLAVSDRLPPAEAGADEALPVQESRATDQWSPVAWR